MPRLATVLVLVAACGDAAAPALGANIVLSGLLADEVTRLSVFAFGPKRSDDVYLTCSTLLPPAALEPDDPRLEQLARTDVDFAAAHRRDVVLDAVSAGPGRIVYVRALGALGVRLGSGCEEGITVEDGATAYVEVTVYPL